MDLDLWKNRLHETGKSGGPSLGQDEIAAILDAGIRKSRRSVARTFLLELAGVALLYVMVWAMAFFVGPLRSFQIKIIALSAAGALPIIIFFGRFFAAARPDMGRPVPEVLDESVRRLRTSLRIYRWGGLVMAAAMGAALWADASFRGLAWGWKWGTTIYILAVAILSFPYLRVLYGRRLRDLEELSCETREAGNGPDSKSVP